VIERQWGRLRHEWRQNARLRWGALVVVAILGLQLVMRFMDDRTAVHKEFERTSDLFVRLDTTAAETAWPARADATVKARDALLASIPEARTEGAARADLQAWLSRLATDAVVDQPSVVVDTVIDVPDYPELRQAVGRVEGTVATPRDVAPFVRGLASGLPWVQADQVEIGEGQPARVSAIVRAYYRRPGVVGTAPGGPATARVAPGAANTVSRSGTSGDTSGPTREAAR
jgi:hypothetical protein